MYLQKYDLKGRTAVVTGGGRGIGLACCQALAEAGARVVIADLDPAVAEAGKAELKKAGLAADAVQLDVTKSAPSTSSSPMPASPAAAPAAKTPRTSTG
jgi:NAD(P)-dependent dehydrogenase (short-subunit alcohol dehydrogenase family)